MGVVNSSREKKKEEENLIRTESSVEVACTLHEAASREVFARAEPSATKHNGQLINCTKGVTRNSAYASNLSADEQIQNN